MPALLDTRAPVEITQQGDKIFIRYAEWDATRTVYTNPRNGPPTQQPSAFGVSFGRWEGETLAIFTTYIAYPYFDLAGTPQSAAVSVLERYTPSADGSRLESKVTVTDAATFTAPVVIAGSMAAVGAPAAARPAGRRRDERGCAGRERGKRGELGRRTCACRGRLRWLSFGRDGGERLKLARLSIEEIRGALRARRRARHAASAQQAQARPAARRAPALREPQETLRARARRAHAPRRDAELRARLVARGRATHRRRRRSRHGPARGARDRRRRHLPAAHGAAGHRRFEAPRSRAAHGRRAADPRGRPSASASAAPR